MDRKAINRTSDDSERSVFVQNQGSSGPQIAASLIASFGGFCAGTVIGWSSPAGPQLKDSTDIGTLTDWNISLIASIAVLGALISGFAAGYAVDKLGRRLTIILLVIPLVAGWMMITFAQNYQLMLAGRFITGLCLGSYTVALPVYISEITQDRLRGTLSSCMVVALVSGILFSYVLGALVPWRPLSFTSGVLPIILAIAMIFVPDSPRYQLEKGRRADAMKSLQWLRGMHCEGLVDEEMKEMEISIQRTLELSRGSICEKLNARTLKPIGVCIMLMVFQQFGGINAVLFFTVDIFKASGSDIDPNVAAIIVGSVQVVCVIIATLLIERAGRKVLMFVSETGMVVSLVALGVFFYLKEQNNDKTPENLGWLPLVSMIVYIITYNLGCASLPWTFMGELCPSHVKGFASALVTSVCWGLAFLVTLTFADLLKLMGEHYVFWLFALFSTGGALFTVFILPETKGKTLDEIQQLY